jgi:hypothetical protein
MNSFANFIFLSFEVQVGLHELLGHGCGKILQETSPGVYNFDHKNPPVSPITQKPVTSYYKPGETWGSVFGGMGPSYEECRAESVAMSLVSTPDDCSEVHFADVNSDSGLQYSSDLRFWRWKRGLSHAISAKAPGASGLLTPKNRIYTEKLETFSTSHI